MEQHIPPERLYELAQKSSVIEEPEWHAHLKHCPECARQYVELLRERITKERTRQNGSD